MLPPLRYSVGPVKPNIALSVKLDEEGMNCTSGFLNGLLVLPLAIFVNEWRKLHNEELSDLYSLPNIVRVLKSRRMGWVGYVARMGKGRGVHRVLVEKPEGKRQLGRPRRRWEDNTKMDLQEVGCRAMDWIDLAEDRNRWRARVNVIMKLRVP
jgi:hypothetical protein